MTGKYRLVFLTLSILLLAASGAFLLLIQQKGGAVPVFYPAQTQEASYSAEALNQTAPVFPFTIEGTPLLVQGLAAYEGPSLEDGGNASLSNVAALILCNTGEKGIFYGKVSLRVGGRELCFEFTYLPPGARILIPEKDGKAYCAGTVSDCKCTRLVEGHFDMAQGRLAVRQEGLSGIRLQNLSGQDLHNVTLYYKLHLSGEDIYVGGITYRLAVSTIRAGQTLQLTPERFVWGYSAIVEIAVGEE